MEHKSGVKDTGTTAVKPAHKELTQSEKIVEGMTVGGNAMANMEPFGALIGAAIGGLEALGSDAGQKPHAHKKADE